MLESGSGRGLSFVSDQANKPQKVASNNARDITRSTVSVRCVGILTILLITGGYCRLLPLICMMCVVVNFVDGLRALQDISCA